MKNYLVIFLTLTLIACGPSQDEKENIAAVTCSIMGESRNMDGAIRVREMNAAREKIGGEPFLRGDAVIKEAFEYGLCEELVLNAAYDESLGVLKDAERERERIAAEEKRIRDNKLTVKEEFYPNGELERRTNYRGFNRHGLMRMWHDNGQLEMETTYKDGKKHGLYRRWHDNGQLWWETTYKDGRQDGLYRSWNEDGSRSVEKCYQNGKETFGCAHRAPKEPHTGT